MKIAVVTGDSGSDIHDAPVIDHDTADGELRIIRRDADGRATGWKLYAAGQWLNAELMEPMDGETVRVRAMAAERDRPNGGPFTTPAGNSGPQ